MPFIALILSGAALATSTLLSRSYPAPPDAWTESGDEPPVSPDFTEPLRQGLSALDERWQQLLRNHLDPRLVGEQRTTQLQTLSRTGQLVIRPRERLINRRLGLGLIAIGMAGLIDLYAWPLLPLVVAIGVYNVWPSIREGWRVGFEEGRFSILHLMLIYFAVLWFGGNYLVGTIGLIFTNLCQKIELLTQTITRHDLTHLFGQQPQTAWILLDGVEVEIPFGQLQAGDILLLGAGQQVPVDGVIVEGTATIDQHRLTGEAQPVEKAVGDGILAATLILGGRIRVRVEKTGAETAAARIGEILQRTVERQESRLVDYFKQVEKTRVPMLAGGALGWIVGGPTTAAAMLGCNYLLGMIPLRLITLLNGLKTGTRHSLLVKDGRALDRLPHIDAVVFDKTGTLTLNQLRIVRIHADSGHEENAILGLAAAAEHRQTHPIARAILAEAEARRLEPCVPEEAHYDLGHGLRVRLNGQAVRIGSLRFMQQEGMALPESLAVAHRNAQEQAHSLVFVSMGEAVAGALEFSPQLRPEAHALVRELKRRGLAQYILSGDQEAPTRKLAAEFGMDGYFANTLPEQKAERIRELQAQGLRVCFVGDGINDAIALHQADVSISFRGATTVATDAAQIVLMEDSLMQIQTLWDLAAKYDETLNANTRLATSSSFIAAGGVLLMPLRLKFWVVELLWAVQFGTSLVIANQALLDEVGEAGDQT